jgi:hypothetical protein
MEQIHRKKKYGEIYQGCSLSILGSAKRLFNGGRAFIAASYFGMVIVEKLKRPEFGRSLAAPAFRNKWRMNMITDVVIRQNYEIYRR